MSVECDLSLFVRNRISVTRKTQKKSTKVSMIVQTHELYNKSYQTHELYNKLYKKFNVC